MDRLAARDSRDVPLQLTATHQRFTSVPPKTYELPENLRNRVNLFLGIQEWPPKAAHVDTPRPDPPANFIARLYEILSVEEYSAIVRWDKKGTSVLFSDPKRFEAEVIPLYFRPVSKSISGFARKGGYDFSQVCRVLRALGFSVVDKRDTFTAEYHHPRFRRDYPEEINQVKPPPPQSEYQTGAAGHQRLGGLTLPRNWTPPPLPGDHLSPFDPMHKMAYPNDHPVPKAAFFSRGSEYHTFSRPGTTATRKTATFGLLRRFEQENERRRRTAEEGEAAKRVTRQKRLTLAKVFVQAKATVHDKTKTTRNASGGLQEGDRSASVDSRVQPPPLSARNAKKEVPEMLVGENQTTPASVNLRIKLSNEGRQARGLSSEMDTEKTLGVILEVETDGRMCKVKWSQSGEEEWICCGFSGKLHLQAVIVVETQNKQAAASIKEAGLSPAFIPGDAHFEVWKINRMKSKVRIRRSDIVREAKKDTYLDDVRKEVARDFEGTRKELNKEIERRKLVKKAQRRQQKGQKPEPDDNLPGSGGASIVDQEPQGPVVNPVREVGKWVIQRGSITSVVWDGQIAELVKVLRKAFKEMPKLASGNLAPLELVTQIKAMGFAWSPQFINSLVEVYVDPPEHGTALEMTCDEFLDIMLDALIRKRAQAKAKPAVTSSSFVRVSSISANSFENMLSVKSGAASTSTKPLGRQPTMGMLTLKRASTIRMGDSAGLVEEEQESRTAGAGGPA